MREFVVRLLTAHVGADKGLLSRDTGRLMKDISSNCHLWKNHRSLHGLIEVVWWSLWWDWEWRGPLRALTVCVLALDKDLLSLRVAGLSGWSSLLQRAEGGEVWIFLSRILPFPLISPPLLLAVALVGVSDDGDSHRGGLGGLGGLLLTPLHGRAGRRRDGGRIVKLHQELGNDSSVRCLKVWCLYLSTFASILSFSSLESLGTWVSKSPSDSWSLVGGVGGWWSSAISSACLLFFMNIVLAMIDSVSAACYSGLNWSNVTVHNILYSLTHRSRYESMMPRQQLVCSAVVLAWALFWQISESQTCLKWRDKVQKEHLQTT